MHFFWQPDGSIDHIGFYLKPNSRNVNTEHVDSFLGRLCQAIQTAIEIQQEIFALFQFHLPHHSA
jgi:hypothetical protein